MEFQLLRKARVDEDLWDSTKDASMSSGEVGGRIYYLLGGLRDYCENFPSQELHFDLAKFSDNWKNGNFVDALISLKRFMNEIPPNIRNDDKYSGMMARFNDMEKYFINLISSLEPR